MRILKFDQAELLESALRKLPLFATDVGHIGSEKLYIGGACKEAELRPCIAFSYFPLASQSGSDAKLPVDSAQVDLPAEECLKITSMSDPVTRELKLPYGELLNQAYKLFKSRVKELEASPSPMAGNKEEWNRAEMEAEDAKKGRALIGWLDNHITEDGKVERIAPDLVLSFFAGLQRLPSSFNLNPEPPVSIYSISDCIFYSLYFSSAAFRSAPALRRCRACKKLFFAKPTNRKYCYFKSNDPELSQLTCKTARETRKAREASNKTQFNKELRNARKKYCDAEGRASTEEARYIENAIEEAKVSLASGNDLWYYKPLLEALRNALRAIKEAAQNE